MTRKDLEAEPLVTAPVDRAVFDPDHQMPLPFKAAQDYARVVMSWAGDIRPQDMLVQRDVAYGPHRLHRYNVFSPPGAANAPVLMFWHGGGWTNGYRDYVSFMARHVVSLGYVLVAPSYRLASECPLPAAYEDSLSALRHVADNIACWGGAGDQLFLAGHSAGAHLAALVALRVADRAAAGVPGPSVRACLPISGIMDLYHPSPAPGSLEERVYTMVLADPAQDAVMSPLCWTTGNRVPFFLTCGEDDSERVMRSNQRMLELLKLQHASASLSVMPAHDHFQTHTSLRDPQHPWYQRLTQLVKESLA